MKIGITTFVGDGGKSGIGRYIINLLREFSFCDNRSMFETLVYECEKDVFPINGNRFSFLPFKENIRSPVLNIFWHQAALPGWCKRRKYDVLFLPAGNRRLPIYSPCPTVGTVHDFSSIHVKGKYDPARMFYITRVLPFLIKKLTRVLTVSESSKKDIVEYAGVPEERVIVTPLAADSNIYFPRNKEDSLSLVEAKYGIGSPYTLYISRIEHPGKNHVRLIRAFERLKISENLPHQLVLVGSDWNGAEIVYKAALKSNHSRDIIFTGFVPTDDLPDLYCGSDLFIFPSLYEGFGLPILEAMSCGVPVACSNMSSMPEVAGKAAKLFDPYDEESIEDAMRFFLLDIDMRKHYAGLGLKRSKEFSWTKTAKRTLKVIKEAAEDGRR